MVMKMNDKNSLLVWLILSIPRALVLSAVEGSDRGAEWVDYMENGIVCQTKRPPDMKVLGRYSR